MTNFALVALLLLPTPAAPRAASTTYRPRIETWTNRGDAVYTRGQVARVYFRTNQDAYVTIVRVDTDGRVRMLFPGDPGEDNFARAGRDYEVESHAGRNAFRIDDYPGVGYVFAVASADPFAYNAVVSGDHWDYRMIAAGRVRGDPYVALTEFAAQIVPPGSADWDYDVIPYYVERHYDYPRFLCYDCHGYTSWTHWNPYHASCVRFRIVVYDNPWYYPYRRYGGNRVVFVRPLRPEPRFIFKDRVIASYEPLVSYERERPVNDVTRRGVRGRDLGGVGAIPPPRQRVHIGDQSQDPRYRPDQPSRPDQPNRPDQRNRPEPHRPDQLDHPDRPSRGDRPDQPGQPKRPDGGDHQDGPARREPSAGADRGRAREGISPPRAEPSAGADRGRVREGVSPPRAEPSAGADRGRAREGISPPRAEPSAGADRGRAREGVSPPRAEPQRNGGSRSEPERSTPELKRRRSG